MTAPCEGAKSNLAKVGDVTEARRIFHESWEQIFIEQVRNIRQQRGWSQRDLADRLATEGFPLHPSAIAKLETGQRPLRVAEAVALASVLGIPPLTVFYAPPPEYELEDLQRQMVIEQEILDALQDSLKQAGERYAGVYAEAQQTAGRIIAARGRLKAGEGLADKNRAAAELPPHIRDNLFAAGGYPPLDDYDAPPG